MVASMMAGAVGAVARMCYTNEGIVRLTAAAVERWVLDGATLRRTYRPGEAGVVEEALLPRQTHTPGGAREVREARQDAAKALREAAYQPCDVMLLDCAARALLLTPQDVLANLAKRMDLVEMFTGNSNGNGSGEGQGFI